MPKPPGLPEFGRSAEAHRIRRLRRLNGRPAAVEEIWLDERFKTPITDRERTVLELFVSPRHFGGLGEALGVDDGAWFDIASRRINQLTTYERELSAEIAAQAKVLAAQARQSLVMLAFSHFEKDDGKALQKCEAQLQRAHEQLRAYGRILGVPVHTAHDRTALEDLLELLSAKKLILIDTAGMAQRDGRTKELLDLLAHPSIKKLLVINTAAQGDAIEDVMHAYQANACAGVILSKLDEAVKLGPALDALIRHKLKVLGVANGQRVPEDWHRLSSQALVHRALRASLNPAYRLDPTEVSLVFSTPSPTESQTSARAM